MFSRTLPLGRIRGIDVRLSPALPLFALVVLWAFTTRFAPAHGLTVALVMGAAGMVLFFGSILVHELGHALEARHRDLEVVGITLSMFGGVTEMHAERQSARDELAVAAIGPYLSLLCAAVLGLVATFVADLLPTIPATRVGEVAGLLAWVNVALAVFNLIPGAPLDGGRVLRAALWAVLRDRQRAIVGAARFGQILWAVLLVVSIWGVVRSPAVRLTATLGAVVALFLFDAARREVTNARLDALYTDLTVGELLGPLPEVIRADTPASARPAPHAARDGEPGSRLALVVDAEGEAVALADLGAADQAAHDGADRDADRDDTRTTPLDGLPRADVGDDLHTLVERFQGPTDIVVVEREGRPFAAVTEREAARAVARLRSRRRASSARPRSDHEAVDA